MLAREPVIKENELSQSAVDDFEVTTSHLNAAIKHYREAALDFGTGHSYEAELNIAIAQRHIRIAQLTQECITVSLMAKANRGS